jgi:hypothetical protein
MSQLGARSISDEDAQLLRACHLGQYQQVYSISPRYFRFECVSSLFLRIVAITSSIGIKLFGDSTGWPLSLPIYIIGVFVFLVGILVGLTTAPDARKLRLIVCETGMLQGDRCLWP